MDTELGLVVSVLQREREREKSKRRGNCGFKKRPDNGESGNKNWEFRTRLSKLRKGNKKRMHTECVQYIQWCSFIPQSPDTAPRIETSWPPPVSSGLLWPCSHTDREEQRCQQPKDIRKPSFHG